MGFTIPDRVNNSMKGSQFGGSIINNVDRVREEAILQQITLGNIPDFMRTSFQISLASGENHLVIDVLPDYFCIGDDGDFLRMPMWPGTAQLIANSFNATLPTRKLVNEIWKMAPVHVAPRPLPPSAHMVSTDAFIRHNQMIELQRAQQPGLIAGHKKDIVVTPKLPLHRVAIYGWHELDGQVIQPLNPTSHSDQYVDYSHGVRLLCRDVMLNDQPACFDDILKDPVLCDLVSDEGPSTYVRYPT